uniref:hypothetical protein n=1 Tax=Amycolatopsis sp. CA-096443 TaxID=3239919 RepID=UPI003F492F92
MRGLQKKAQHPTPAARRQLAGTNAALTAAPADATRRLTGEQARPGVLRKALAEFQRELRQAKEELAATAAADEVGARPAKDPTVHAC